MCNVDEDGLSERQERRNVTSVSFPLPIPISRLFLIECCSRTDDAWDIFVKNYSQNLVLEQFVQLVIVFGVCLTPFE